MKKNIPAEHPQSTTLAFGGQCRVAKQHLPEACSPQILDENSLLEIYVAIIESHSEQRFMWYNS